MVEPDVAQALRIGPFPVALAVALDARGLSLETLAARLAERGMSLSRATLSYWRSGRSQPERVGSLEALTAVEEILEVPAGSLHALLRPRGAPARSVHWPAGSVPRRRLWPARPSALAEVNAPPDGQLEFLAVNDLFVVEGVSGVRLLRVRLVVRALVDGVGRTVVFYQADQHGEPPRWGGLAHCRPGRVRTEGQVTVAELIFDRPLAAGECAVLDYELIFAADTDVSDCYHRSFTRPCRLWTCQVGFVGDLPSRVYRFRQRHQGDTYRDIHDVWLGADRTALVVAEDVRPGLLGVGWQV
ncbi:helix-turn-helix transcriptional regulator [Longispora sp. NPDC051575]|uniref:helix-turn-helix domain-containing protein n=1 Tax=Longispora sp. NPDC051575 TaxID=3154943 RepID=UPI0034180A32